MLVSILCPTTNHFQNRRQICESLFVFFFCYCCCYCFHFNVKAINPLTNKYAPPPPPKQKTKQKSLKVCLSSWFEGYSTQLHRMGERQINTLCLHPCFLSLLESAQDSWLSTFRVGLPSSVKPFYKHPGRLAQKCLSLVFQ